MKKEKAIRIIFTIMILLLLILFIASCGSSDGPTPRFNPYTGTKGMKISFAKNSPPNEAYEGNNLNIIVDAKNEGASDILGGIILLGYEEEVLQADKQSETIDLYGKSAIMTKGEEKLVNFRMNAKKLPPQVEVIESLVSITACYNYRTTFGEEVCVDTDPLNQRIGEKGCDAKGLSASGQGAPVAITKVEVEMLPHEDENRIKPSFKITIENNGEGILFNKDKIEDACSSIGIEKDDINTLYVTRAMLSQNYQLECRPRREQYGPGYVKLKEGEFEMRCTYEAGISKDIAPFTAPLRIELEYGYTQTITKNIMIKKEVFGTI